MGTSIFLAKLIGPIFIAAAIGMLLNAAVFRALFDEFLRSRALMFLSGMLTMTAGMALVLTHNVWTADWRVLITLLGWLGAAGGALRMAAPQWAAEAGNWFLARPSGATAGAILWLALGAILCFFGYFR